MAAPELNIKLCPMAPSSDPDGIDHYSMSPTEILNSAPNRLILQHPRNIIARLQRQNTSAPRLTRNACHTWQR